MNRASPCWRCVSLPGRVATAFCRSASNRGAVDDKAPTSFRRVLFPGDTEILEIIGKLRGLYRATQPDGGGRTASGKDINARTALGLAAFLFKDLAGWAVDHHVGLALAGVSPAPKPINEEQPDDWHRQRTAGADSHEHEATAAQYEFADPILNRQIAAQLLTVDAPLPSRLAYELVRALQALEVGERLAILTGREGAVALVVVKTNCGAARCCISNTARGLESARTSASSRSVARTKSRNQPLSNGVKSLKTNFTMRSRGRET